MSFTNLQAHFPNLPYEVFVDFYNITLQTIPFATESEILEIMSITLPTYYVA